MSGQTSSKLYASVVFNYENLGSLKSVFCCGEVHYGDHVALHHYQGINMTAKTYKSVWNGYDNWDNSIDLATSQNEGFKAVYSGLLFLNEISQRIEK